MKLDAFGSASYAAGGYATRAADTRISPEKLLLKHKEAEWYVMPEPDRPSSF